MTLKLCKSGTRPVPVPPPGEPPGPLLDFPAMQLLVFTVIGLVIFLIAIGIDLGGTLACLLFLTVLLVGATLRAWAPLVEWIRGPAAKV